MTHIKPFLFVCFFGMLSTFAQDFQGIAVYESKTSIGDDFGPPDMPESRKQEIRERMRRAMERTFELNFDKTSSTYEEEEKLETPGTQGRGGMRMGFLASGSGTYYKNVQDQAYVRQSEMFGKMFLIKDSLPQWEWVLGSETKKIGNYTCYKATTIKKEADMTDRFRRMRPRRADSRPGGDPAKKDTIQKNSTSSNSFLSQMEPPKAQEITVWYTPEIPISQGPGTYWGLPGLILEVNDGRTAILCSKLILNPKEEVEIEAPTKGKQVTQKEYDDLMSKKMEEMSERFRNRRRGGNSGRIRG
ncbi:GLPGLI family protein [Flagellimonas myxillae]|uniref:GLPGLI family protein n=1 Tax=Flagellimonas myxillae TaxID=2942214 RepID=UPI00201F47B2|nr:GLPGLI family protein [Muricauda myxillae]MCL6268135.1 GLPGLI family protein [Muricauda myxillae]